MRLEQLEHQLDRERSDHADSKNRLLHAQQDLRETSTLSGGLQEAATGLESRCAALTVELAEFKRALATLEAERDAARAVTSHLETEVTEARNQLVVSPGEFAEVHAELLQLKGLVREQRERLEKQHQLVESANEATDGTRDEGAVLKARVATLERLLEEVSTQAHSLNEALAQSVQQRDDALRHAHQTGSDRESLEAELARLREELSLLQTERATLVDEQRSARAEATGLLKESERRLQERDHSLVELQDSRRQLLELRTELASAREAAAGAAGRLAEVEGAMSAASQHVTNGGDEGLRAEIAQLRSEVADLVEERAALHAQSTGLIRDLDRRLKERDHVNAELQESRRHNAQLTAELSTARAEADEAIAGLVEERAELELQLSNLSTTPHIEHEVPRAAPPRTLTVPSGSVLVAEAELAAHENHVRLLDERRAAEVRRREDMEDQLREAERATAKAESEQRAAQQRLADAMHRHEVLKMSVSDLQRLADQASRQLGLPERSPAQLAQVVPDLIARLQDRVSVADAQLTTKDVELERLRALLLRRVEPEAVATSEPASEEAPAAEVGNARADRLLDMLRQAAEDVGARS